MTSLWLGMLVLLALCVVVFVWPLFRAKKEVQNKAGASRSQANVSLYHEHLAELDANLAAGDIDENMHAQLCVELQRNLLADQGTSEASSVKQGWGRGLLLGGLTLLVLAGVALYLVRGSVADLHLQNMQGKYAKLDYEDLQNNVAANVSRSYELIELIRDRLKAKPDNDQYWYLLAVYAMRVSDYPVAIEGYRGVYRLNPTDARNTAALAQALFLNNSNRMSDEVRTLAEESLQLDPNDSTALGLMGISSFERKEYPQAATYWRAAAAQLPADAPGRAALLSGVRRAEASMGQAPEGTNTNEPTWTASVKVSVNKDLPPIKGTLFVFMRRWQGPPMPLVASRISTYTLPMSVVLDESMAMIDKNQLINAGQVELVARISLNGTAMAGAGDIEGRIGPFDANALPDSLELIIDTQL